MKFVNPFKLKKKLTREELRTKALEAKFELDELKEDEKARQAIQELEDFKLKKKENG